MASQPFNGFGVFSFWRSVSDGFVKDHPLALLRAKALDEEQQQCLEKKKLPSWRVPVARGDGLSKPAPFLTLMPPDEEDGKCFDDEWWYYPRMSRRDIMAIPLYDLWKKEGQVEGWPTDKEEADLNDSTFHGAFEDNTAGAGAEARRSLEIRAVLFFADAPGGEAPPVWTPTGAPNALPPPERVASDVGSRARSDSTLSSVSADEVGSRGGYGAAILVAGVVLFAVLWQIGWLKKLARTAGAAGESRPSV